MNSFLVDEEKRHALFAVAGGLSLLASFVGWKGALPFDPAWIAVLLCGYPIVKGAVIGLFTRFDVKADVLVAMALVAAVIIGEIFAAGEVAFIMALGSLLEERTVRKARDGIEKLVSLAPPVARLVRDGQEQDIAAETIRIGDVLRVLPGETIPADGEIIAGRTAVDQSLLTGESLPVDKGEHDPVFSGTVNQLGSFDMRATQVGENSSLQRMIRLVETADAAKTPIVRTMDRWATWIVFAALLTAVGTWLITGETIRAVTVLVVFCPCALVLATPTAISAGIGNASRFGVLIASGDALERLARITRVVFDKTGTLTHGKPEVSAIRSFLPELNEKDILSLAAAVERRSEHPLGRAVMRRALALGVEAADPEQFLASPGLGVRAVSHGQTILSGNLQFMREHGLRPDQAMLGEAESQEALGGTVMYVGLENRLAGLIAFTDTLRPRAVEVVRRLHELGLRTLLLTGDNPAAARAIGKATGLDEIRSGLLPQDKLAVITQDLRDEVVCMVGDGINDAPALKAAHVGLAMGGVGSDIAVDAADAVFVQDDILRLPQLVLLARKTVQTIKVNICLSMFLNVVTVVLAAAGVMGPVSGALAHNAGALLIVLNSARLLKWRPPFPAT